jgi:hypothetical protein
MAPSKFQALPEQVTAEQYKAGSVPPQDGVHVCDVIPDNAPHVHGKDTAYYLVDGDSWIITHADGSRSAMPDAIFQVSYKPGGPGLP